MSTSPVYDPRIGDEELPLGDLQEAAGTTKGTTPEEEASNLSTSSSGAEGGTKKDDGKSRFKLPSTLQWIPANWTWSKAKPVIRCAISAWVCLLLVIIPESSKFLGQASFLVIIAAVIAPPSTPFIAVFETVFIQILLVALSWAWCCLAIKLGNLARVTTDLSAPTSAIFNGEYLEAAPTTIMAVFLFLGSAIILYIKARQGPGPFAFACVFSCICIDISITTAVLFPYPYYNIGKAILVPIAIHGVISLILSVLLFPSTISSLYAHRFHAVVEPLGSIISEHRRLLKTSTSNPDFSPANVNGLVTGSEAALGPLAATLHLLKQDVVWSRISPEDISGLHGWARKLAVRANGMSIYFSLIDPTRERFPITPAPSHPATPIGMTPFHSRSPSPRRNETGSVSPPEPEEETDDYPSSTTSKSPSVRFARRRRVPHLSHLHIINHMPSRNTYATDHHKHHLSHGSLLHIALAHAAAPSQPAVGVFESQRYVDMEETRFNHPSAADYTERFHGLLGESSDELLETCSEALGRVDAWFLYVLDKRRLNYWRNKAKKDKGRAERLEKDEKMKAKLQEVLERFRASKRHLVIDPYRSGFDPTAVGAPMGEDLPPSHRHLFHCYMYQYHLIQFGVVLAELLEEIIKLKKKRTKSKLWMPTMPISQIFSWGTWSPSDNMEREDDEDPDVIPGMEPEWIADLGSASRRDPDALPPRNAFEWVMNFVHQALSGLSHGNVLFALKAGLLSIVLSLPNFFQSTALFAYQNKFVWGLFMGQLTLVRFRGDTTFGLVARIGSTLFGCVLGLIVWYISTGTGHGNAYGLAATCAVCFPFFFYARLYWPVPAMTNIILFVTSVLVVGYSWIDTHPQFPSTFLHWGVDLAIRRFILVSAGVFAAFIFSFLPPSTTLRNYQRNSLATTSGEIGAIYCSIVSYANTRKHSEEELQKIITSLIAIRMKLKRSIVLKTNIIYEFSLRGRWPAKRYHTIVELQLQIAYMLSHLMSVVEHLEPAWSRAFLRRSRFLDADFQGEVLAVISLVSTSLRTGTPLPQITPCPLLDRFSRYNHGLNVVRQEADDEYGLPKTMTIDTLENEQYLFFCVGVTTAFGLINRLDKLMVATKELVGEQYHIHGIGLVQRGGDDLDNKSQGTRGRARTSDIRPMKDV